MENNNNTLEEFLAAAKAKGIPEKYAKRYYTDGIDAEIALSELETEWAEFKQIAVNNSVDTNGGVTAGVKDIEGDASKAIKSFAKKNVDASKAEPKYSFNYLMGQVL